MVEPQFQSQEKSSIDFQFIFCVSPVPKGKDLSQKKKKWLTLKILLKSLKMSICILPHGQSAFMYTDRYAYFIAIDRKSWGFLQSSIVIRVEMCEEVGCDAFDMPVLKSIHSKSRSCANTKSSH